MRTCRVHAYRVVDSPYSAAVADLLAVKPLQSLEGRWQRRKQPGWGIGAGIQGAADAPGRTVHWRCTLSRPVACMAPACQWLHPA